MNTLYALRRARDLFGSRRAWVDGDRSVTYREFFRDVERSAVFQEGLRLESGDRIAVLMGNSPAYLELYYSTALAGTVIVPLNTRWNIDDILFSLTDSGSKALVLDDRFTRFTSQLRGALPGMLLVHAGRHECPAGMIDYRAGVAEVGETPTRWAEPDESDLAGLFYTSGTTGGPKGVMLTHRNVMHNMLFGMISGFAGGQMFLHSAPMFHLADGAAIHSTTVQGGAHAFLESFDPEEFLATVQARRITRSVLIPTMINMVVNHPNFDRYDVSSLEYIMYGGSPMPVPLLELAMRKLKCKFQQGYGMTETSPLLTILANDDHRLERLDEPFTPVKSAGKPIVGMEVRVVDELDRELPPGTPGEIIARGPNVMKGYWNRPEINAEVLRGGWMHTGDIGAFDAEGFLYILDRKKDMIKSGGENVYSPEVESKLLAHPAILEAAIIGMTHPTWGETIRAVVVVRPGMQLTEPELIAWSRERMTHFKCPTSVVFLDVLPKGGTGKVQKAALRKMVTEEKASGAFF